MTTIFSYVIHCSFTVNPIVSPQTEDRAHQRLIDPPNFTQHQNNVLPYLSLALRIETKVLSVRFFKNVQMGAPQVLLVWGWRVSAVYEGFPGWTFQMYQVPYLYVVALQSACHPKAPTPSLGPQCALERSREPWLLARDVWREGASWVDKHWRYRYKLRQLTIYPQWHRRLPYHFSCVQCKLEYSRGRNISGELQIVLLLRMSFHEKSFDEAMKTYSWRLLAQDWDGEHGKCLRCRRCDRSLSARVGNRLDIDIQTTA